MNKSSNTKKPAPNSLTKPADWKPKPRSPLQKAQAQTNWAVHFKLHPMSTCLLDSVSITTKTRIAIAKYNQAMRELKASIQADYDYMAAQARENKKHLDK